MDATYECTCNAYVNCDNCIRAAVLNAPTTPWSGEKKRGSPLCTGDNRPHSEPKKQPVDWKDTNPKDAVGISKTPISTLPTQVMAEVGVAMLEGALKYARHNYRVAGVRASVYYDATFRHLAAWWEGEDIDPDSGLSHITKAIACLMVIRDSMLQGNWVDDRPPRAANPEWLRELNARSKALIEKYPDPELPWTQKRVEQEEAA